MDEYKDIDLSLNGVSGEALNDRLRPQVLHLSANKYSKKDGHAKYVILKPLMVRVIKDLSQCSTQTTQ